MTHAILSDLQRDFQVQTSRLNHAVKVIDCRNYLPGRCLCGSNPIAIVAAADSVFQSISRRFWTQLDPIFSKLLPSVTGLTVADFHLLVKLKVINTERINQAVFAFRRYEDASLRQPGSADGYLH